MASFLERLKSQPADAFLTLRALALSLGPDVVERVQDRAVCYLRRDRGFLTAEASRARLLAIFPSGCALDDPMGRLLRRGQERYAALDSAESVDAHVQEFVRKAYAAAR